MLVTLNSVFNYYGVNAFFIAGCSIIRHIRSCLEDFTLDARCKFIASARACLSAHRKQFDIKKPICKLIITVDKLPIGAIYRTVLAVLPLRITRTFAATAFADTITRTYISTTCCGTRKSIQNNLTNVQVFSNIDLPMGMHASSVVLQSQAFPCHPA